MKWIAVDDYDELSRRAAAILLQEIQRDPQTVLGLPTGRTPEGMYANVVAECAREYRCFREVATFNLDEYVGIPRSHPASYYSYMKNHLFDHVDLDPMRRHIPYTEGSDLEAECRRYEEEITREGGLRLTFLGLGTNGHIGFNEPGTPFDSRTRVVTLHESTRAANAAHFPDGRVPERAVTIGIGTILESRSIVLLASGAKKAPAIARVRSGEITEEFPASALLQHPDVTIVVDRAAGG